MARKNPLHDRILAKRDCRHIRVRRDDPLHDHLGIGGDQKILPQGLRGSEANRLVKETPNGPVIVVAEGRQRSRPEIKGGMVADDHRYRSLSVALFILLEDVQKMLMELTLQGDGESLWAYVHVFAERDIVKILL